MSDPNIMELRRSTDHWPDQEGWKTAVSERDNGLFDWTTNKTIQLD